MNWLRLARRFAWLSVRRTRDRVGARATWRAQLFRPDGSLRCEHDLGTMVLDTGWGKNVVVDTGLDAQCERLFNSAGLLGVFENLAIGTDATPELNTDTDLGAEVARAQATYSKGGVGVMTLAHTFPAAGGYEPAAIAEAGLFDALGAGPASGTMYNRKTFTPFTKEATDTLKMTCTLTYTSL